MIERDLDVSAGRGEVLANQTVVEAAQDESLWFERFNGRSLKGNEEPVVLFCVTRPEH